MVPLQTAHDGALLIFRKPIRFFRSIDELVVDENSRDSRRKPFGDEQPLPTVQSENSFHRQERRRDQSTQTGAQRHRQEENNSHSPAIFVRKPLGHVKEDAAEQSSFIFFMAQWFPNEYQPC